MNQPFHMMDDKHVEEAYPIMLDRFKKSIKDCDLKFLEHQIIQQLPIHKETAINVRIPDLPMMIAMLENSTIYTQKQKAAYIYFVNNALQYLSSDSMLKAMINRLSEAYFVEKYHEIIKELKRLSNEFSVCVDDWLDLHTFDEEGFPICLSDPYQYQKVVMNKFEETEKFLDACPLKEIEDYLKERAKNNRLKHKSCCNNKDEDEL